MPLEIYRHSPQFAAQFWALLPQFGATPELTQWAERYAKFHAGRCYWDAQFVARDPIRRCLNIGGAPYLFELALKKTIPKADITSVDINPERFPRAGSLIGIRRIAANIETDSLPAGETFDLVVFTEIFEHLRIDLLGTMVRVRNLLTDDGRLYLTTPNGQGFSAWRKRLLRGRTGPSVVDEWSKLTRLGHMGHVREYSLTEIREVLTYCGFAIEDARFRVRRRTWPERDLIARIKPGLADEILIVARKSSMPEPNPKNGPS